MVSVFYFTPLSGFFSPFPHGTCSLSVIRKYLALRDGSRGFRQHNMYRRTQDTLKRLHDFAYAAFTLYSHPFQNVLLSSNFVTPYRVSYNPSPKTGLGCYRFARHYSGNRFFFLFLLLLRCFSSQGCLHTAI